MVKQKSTCKCQIRGKLLNLKKCYMCYMLTPKCNTGAKLWLNRDSSNPRPFTNRANTTTELPSYPVISPTTFHLKPTPVT